MLQTSNDYMNHYNQMGQPLMQTSQAIPTYYSMPQQNYMNGMMQGNYGYHNPNMRAPSVRMRDLVPTKES